MAYRESKSTNCKSGGCWIGIIAPVEISDSIDDLSRALCRGPGVEVNEFAVVDGLRKCRKL